MPFTPSGIEYLDPDAPFDPTGIALADSLEGRVFVPVANVTERDALAATFVPAPGKPLLVYRADAPVGARFEVSEAGTAFRVANAPVNSGWVAPTSLNAAWNTNSATVRSRLVGNGVHLRGLFRPNTGDMGVGTHGSLATLVTGHRPPSGSTYHFTAVAWVNGGTPPERPRVSVNITDAGVINGYASEVVTGFWVDNIWFLTD